MVPSYSTFTPLQWLLSLSVAGTFIGHGLNALSGGEPKMFHYLAVAGIGRSVGGPLVRIIGAFDVALGVAALVWQWEGVLVAAALWGFATAIMRPIAGESPLAALECTGNFLPAVALLYLNTSDELTTYYWSMVALVLALLGASASLLLRQSGMLADAPARRSTAKRS